MVVEIKAHIIWRNAVVSVGFINSVMIEINFLDAIAILLKPIHSSY